ncbi:MAG TPA: DHA2 family efflux MFS transporter permease subunit [Streptosporangiaceae bacterium]|jgi:EmrB/QacA subfamily drug resistance transporter
MSGSDARKWWALVAIAASVLVVGLDLTVLSLALPVLSAQLHASTSDLQWFSAAYSLVLAAALLPAGLLGDRMGRKKLLLIALVLFGISSAACAFSTSSAELIAARAVLGLGAAAIFPMSIAVLPVLFTEEERPRAIAVVMGATFIGYPVGPLLGGWLLDNFWWGSVFLINVPVVVLALVAVALLMPESHGARATGIDLPGIALSSLGLASLTYGFIKAGQDGWSDATAVATMVAGAVLLVAFVAWERWITGRGQPLIQLELFRSAGFTWGTVLVTFVSFAMFGILFAIPQYFQEVLGFDSFGSGLRLLPLIGGMVVGMLAGTRLQTPRTKDGEPVKAAPLGARPLVTVGFAVMAAALAVGAATKVTSGTGLAVAWLTVAGLGLGLAMPAAMNVALGALSPERSGSGSALITALRQVGATIGVAVLGTVLLSGYRSRLSLGHLPTVAAEAVRSSVAGGVAVARATHSADLLIMVRTAYVHGQDVMLAVCAVIALASAVLALIFLPRRVAVATPAGAAATPAGGPATTAGAPAAPTAPPVAADGTGAVGVAAADGTARPVAAGLSSEDNQHHDRARRR